MTEWITVYHGHQDDETLEHAGKFFTTDRNFAENYGEVVEYEIRLGNVLNTIDPEVAKKVIIPLKIEDPYEGSLVTWEYWNDFSSDTWEMVEHNLDQLLSRYYDVYGQRADSILVTEGGAVNYIVRDVANMRKKETALTEAFDSALPLQWVDHSNDDMNLLQAQFQIDDGLFIVQFKNVYYNPGFWELTFVRNGTLDLTNTGNAAQVLATVMQAAREFLAAKNPRYLTLAAKNDEVSRSKLYPKLIALLHREFPHYMADAPKKLRTHTSYRFNRQVVESKGDESIMEALRTKYREYNQLYFDNQLPIIPLRWGALKTSTAHVGFKIIGSDKLVDNSMVMVFSNKYKRDAESLFPILLHEMIHVYIAAVLGDVREHHGKKFHAMLATLRQKSGIDVPLTDTSTKGLELSEPLQTVGVITQKTYDGRLAYALFSPTVIRNSLDTIIKSRWANAKRDNVEVRLVTSELWTRKASNMPVQRKIGGKTKFWMADEESKQDLLQHSELLWTNQLEEDVAYHGSARDFEVFDGAHVGTGDGALTFGWGVYLAGNKNVAKMFRQHGEGKLFEVDLPEQDRLLDWDKKYDEQSASVKASLKAMNIELLIDQKNKREYAAEEDEMPEGADDIHTYDGNDIYSILLSISPVKVTQDHTRDQAMSKYNGWKRRASAWMLKNGIEGIRYRDVIIGDNYNYVIFDPSRIRIKKKS